MNSFFLFVAGALFFLIFGIPLFGKYLNNNNPFATFFFYLFTVGGFIAYFFTESEIIRYWFYFISFPSVIFVTLGIIMKKLVKKESKVDQFIDDIYKQTFSDDEKQNKREIDFLKEELGVGYSEDKIKSLFLRATTKFYLKVLDKKGFGQEVFSKEFASSEGIPIDDAITLYTVVAMKFASRISGNETSGSDF